MLRIAQEWAAENYGEADIVTAMSKIAKLPIKTFARRFKAATGYGPLEYVQRLRIEESKQMLETGAAGVDEVAAEVGYSDAASFRRLFKRLVGESPVEYRRRQCAPDFVSKLPK